MDLIQKVAYGILKADCYLAGYDPQFINWKIDSSYSGYKFYMEIDDFEKPFHFDEKLVGRVRRSANLIGMVFNLEAKVSEPEICINGALILYVGLNRK